MGAPSSGYRDRDLSMHKFMCFANMSQCTKILGFVLDVAETQVYNQGTNMRLYDYASARCLFVMCTVLCEMSGIRKRETGKLTNV